MSPAGRIPAFEMSTIKTRENSVAQGSSHTMREPVYDDEATDSVASRVLDSFRRDPGRRVTPLDPKDEAAIRAEAGRAEHDGLRYYDIHQATLQTAHSGLARKLKGRHLQMIAIGGSIGMFPRLFLFFVAFFSGSRGFPSSPGATRSLSRIYLAMNKPSFPSREPCHGFSTWHTPRYRTLGCTLSDMIPPGSKAPDCSSRLASR